MGCFVGCCFLDLFNTAPSILVQFSFSFFSIRLVSVPVVHTYSRIDTTTAWKILHLILSDKSDFHMIKYLLIPVHVFTSRILMSFSVHEMLLLLYMNLSTDFRENYFSFLLKTHALHLVCIHMETNATCSRLCNRDLAWVGVFSTDLLKPFGVYSSINKNLTRI